MTIETFPSTAQPRRPLLDIFSSSLGELIEQAQANVVQVRREGRGAGTGVVWDGKGGIVTNHHVVDGAGTKIHVELHDGRVLEARVVDSDPTLDVALLNVPEDNQQIEYIKSDVRLLPGNSGGPLLNAQGQVVGINAMIMGGDLSVAIPSNEVSNWLAQLPQTRITLGVQIQPTELPANIRQELANGQTLGLLVVGIIAGGLAEQAGVLVGDVLLDIANKPLHDVATLRAVLAQNSTQEMIRLRVLRGGVVQEIDVALTAQEQAA